METVCLENTLCHDGVALLHYRLLCPPCEGPFDFALPMTEGYRDYLEGAFFASLSAAYDADATRRKRYRYKTLEVSQHFSVREEGVLVSISFFVHEGARCFSFGVTMDPVQGVAVTPKRARKAVFVQKKA